MSAVGEAAHARSDARLTWRVTWPLGLAMAVLAGLGLTLALGPEARLGYLFYDDAYYYFGVARSLAAGAGSTFDGINATNGYHPLWCWLLVPLFLVVDDPGLATRLIGLLWYAVSALAVVALFVALRRRTGALGAAAAAAIFGLHPVIGLGIARPNGLETPLFALLIALFAALWERQLGPESGAGNRFAAGRMLGLGVALGLVILARLDGGMLAVAAALLLAWLAWRAGGLARVARSVGLLTLGAVLVAGPSLAWNAVRFGSPVPISQRALQVWGESARAELGGPASAEFWRRRAWHGVESIPIQMGRAVVGRTRLANPFWRLGKVAGVAVLGGTALLTLAALRLRRRRVAIEPGARVHAVAGASPPDGARSMAGDALLLLALFSALHYAAYAGWFWTASEKGYRLYYFMPQVMLVAAALGTLLGRVRPRFLLPVAIAGMLVFSVAGVRAEWGTVPSEPGPLARRGLFGWIRDSLAPAAVVSTTDAGRLGFFCGRPTVNLDGLINDERFLAALAGQQVPQYVCASPITHVVTGVGALHGFDPDRPEIPPAERDFLGDLLYGIGRVPGCSVRRAGTVDNWLIFSVERSAAPSNQAALSRGSR